MEKKIKSRSYVQKIQQYDPNSIPNQTTSVADKQCEKKTLKKNRVCFFKKMRLFIKTHVSTKLDSRREEH